MGGNLTRPGRKAITAARIWAFSLKIYFRRGFARVEIALARGRKLHDKREALKKADARKEMKRALGKRR